MQSYPVREHYGYCFSEADHDVDHPILAADFGDEHIGSIEDVLSVNPESPKGNRDLPEQTPEDEVAVGCRVVGRLLLAVFSSDRVRGLRTLILSRHLDQNLFELRV